MDHTLGKREILGGSGAKLAAVSWPMRSGHPGQSLIRCPRAGNGIQAEEPSLPASECLWIREKSRPQIRETLRPFVLPHSLPCSCLNAVVSKASWPLIICSCLPSVWTVSPTQSLSQGETLAPHPRRGLSRPWSPCPLHQLLVLGIHQAKTFLWGPLRVPTSRHRPGQTGASSPDPSEA